MEELQRHQGEWFFLRELNVDKVFSTMQRATAILKEEREKEFPAGQ